MHPDCPYGSSRASRVHLLHAAASRVKRYAANNKNRFACHSILSKSSANGRQLLRIAACSPTTSLPLLVEKRLRPDMALGGTPSVPALKALFDSGSSRGLSGDFNVKTVRTGALRGRRVIRKLTPLTLDVP